MTATVRPDLSIHSFESGEIDPLLFDHEAHAYVGWLYVREYELAEAVSRFDAALKRLVGKLGVEGKYHATLSWFFLLLIAERVQTDEPWPVFRQRNADLIDDSKSILSNYYSNETLFSDRARERFVLPDNLASA